VRAAWRAPCARRVSINNVMVTEGNPALRSAGRSRAASAVQGEPGLHAFCNLKSVIVDKDSGKIESNWYPYTAASMLFSDLTTHLFGAVGSPGEVRLAGLRLERYSPKRRSRGGSSAAPHYGVPGRQPDATRPPPI